MTSEIKSTQNIPLNGEILDFPSQTIKKWQIDKGKWSFWKCKLCVTRWWGKEHIWNSLQNPLTQQPPKRTKKRGLFEIYPYWWEKTSSQILWFSMKTYRLGGPKKFNPPALLSSLIFRCAHTSLYEAVSVCLFVHPCIHLSVSPSDRPSICPSIHPCCFVLKRQLKTSHWTSFGGRKKIYIPGDQCEVLESSWTVWPNSLVFRFEQ